MGDECRGRGSARIDGGDELKSRGTRSRFAIASLAFGLIVVACGGGSSGGSKGTVNIAVNAWVGYTADAAVVAYVLENKMNYKVNLKDLKEDVSWAGFEAGDVDVILEDWGHPDFEQKYITDKKVAMLAGSTGNEGVIFWGVPAWMAEEYPDITDYKNLNKYADLFKTSESGDLGQFLGTDPSYIQFDEALVKNLGLNFKVIFSGSETATVQAIKTANEQKKALLLYWWDPHWLNAQVEMVKVNLPPYTAGCDADKEKVACDYPVTDLQKIISTKFNNEGGDAATLVKNFHWTNADQNAVADDITNNGMTPEQAAKKWVDANEAVWKAWVP
jgi:glycine betaine/proline transport system substrate-binding protein